MRLVAVLCVVAFSATVYADQVTMKNGDRLSGKIIETGGGKLKMKTELAGEVEIPWDAVTAITSDAPLNVGLKDGQLVVGAVTTSGNQLEIATKEAGKVSAAKDSVEYVRSEEAQADYNLQMERLRNPRLVDLWSGSVDLGFATTGGNSRVRTFNLGANAERATTRDRIAIHFRTLYSYNNTGGVALTTANFIRGGINYDLRVTDKWFVWGSTALEYDQFQSLDLRFVPSGGTGWYVIKDENTNLNVRAGGSWNREFFNTGLKRSSAEVVIGQEFVKKFNERFRIEERLLLFPNLSETGEFRMNFDTTAVTNLTKWMGFTIGVSDRYLSNPVQGRLKNDIAFTTGVQIAFKK